MTEQQAFPPPAQPQQRNKSKLWLWITIAVVIPLLLCIAGLYFIKVAVDNTVSSTSKGLKEGVKAVIKEGKPPIDATNSFYRAVENNEDLEPYLCRRLRDKKGFTEEFRTRYGSNGNVEVFYFLGFYEARGKTTTSGTVTRNGVEYSAVVTLQKENGNFRVCGVEEKPFENS